MKYLSVIIFLIAFFQLNAQSIEKAIKFIPTNGLISCEYTIEIHNTSGNEEGVKSKKTLSKVKSILSITDERMVIAFTPREMRIVDNEGKEINRSRQEVTYVFDGMNWLQYGYQTTYTKDQKTVPTEYFKVLNAVPGAMDTLLDIYSAKVFLFDQFVFYDPRTRDYTVKNILLNQAEFEACKFEQIENDIQINLESETNTYSALVSLEPFFPHIKHYRIVYKPSEDKTQNQDRLTTDYIFSGKLPLMNTPISVPQKMERIYFNEGRNGGFVMSITLESIEFIADKDFEEFIPEVPVGWQVIDEPKGITYKKADTKEGILKTIRNL